MATDNYCVYILTCTATSLQYVGKTNDLDRRLAEHVYEAKNGGTADLHKAIREYGWEHFEHSVYKSDLSFERCDALGSYDDQDIEYSRWSRIQHDQRRGQRRLMALGHLPWEGESPCHLCKALPRRDLALGRISRLRRPSTQHPAATIASEYQAFVR